MRYRHVLALVCAVTCIVSGQALEKRTYRFHNATTEQDYKEIATAALMISGLKTVPLDVSGGELLVRGSSEQIRVADWVVAELDRPASAIAPPSSNLTLETKETEDTIRVFYPGQSLTTQAFNEVLTAVRVISDIRYVAPYTSHRAVVMRGRKEQLDLAEWTLSGVNRDSPQETMFPTAGTEFRTVAESVQAEDNQVRIFRFPRGDVQYFNEVQTMIRTLTDTRRVYPYIANRAIVLRGTTEQMDMARWIAAQFDKELPLALETTSSDYPMKEGELMRLFYFRGTMTVEEFKELATNMRTATGIRRVYPFVTARTVAVRASSFHNRCGGKSIDFALRGAAGMSIGNMSFIQKTDALQVQMEIL